MAITLKEVADFQFDLDAMNLDPNMFPFRPESDSNIADTVDSWFDFNVAYNPPANAPQLLVPLTQSSEPTWTLIPSQPPMIRESASIPSS